MKAIKKLCVHWQKSRKLVICHSKKDNGESSRGKCALFVYFESEKRKKVGLFISKIQSEALINVVYIGFECESRQSFLMYRNGIN